MAKTEGYIVTVEVFISHGYVKEMKRGTLNTKKEIAGIEVEEALENVGLGYEILNIRKVVK